MAAITSLNIKLTPVSVFLYFFLFLLSRHTSGNNIQQLEPHKRFEYKYSFKGPFLTQKDGSVPFWEYGGNALPSEAQVRVASSLPSQKGYMWTKKQFDAENWEIEAHFRVSGRGRIGADGLAIWFTSQKGMEGPVYGSSDLWNGLGVFFDSFDNDGQRNNPYILSVVNDGTKSYDHNSDGMSQQLGGCLRDFRNKPFPVRVRIQYYLTTLTVYINSGMTNRAEDYELCLRAEHVFLPRIGHFGVSAATGGLADDHDVLSFLVYKLTAPLPQDAEGLISEEEKQKFNKEFDDYFEKLEKQKEDYRKQHPDKVKQDQFKPEDFVDSLYDQEVKLIFDAQSKIHDSINVLSRKMDEIIGRQERSLSLLSSVSNNQAAVVPQQQGAPPVFNQQGDGTQHVISRAEVEAMLSAQRDVVQSVRDIRNVVGDVQQKALSLQQQQAQAVRGGGGGGGGGGGLGMQGELLMHEIRDNVNNIRNDITQLSRKPQQAGAGMVNCPPLPPLPNCVTPLYFFLFAGVQFVVLLGYAVYRSNQENKAKKFY